MRGAMTKKKTYTMVYVCINCGWKYKVSVPYGEYAPSAPEDLVCEYCGCSFFSNPMRPDDKRVIA
jgi:DNA-directed RNA polymerase subunit RPC12/RpoP